MLNCITVTVDLQLYFGCIFEQIPFEEDRKTGWAGYTGKILREGSVALLFIFLLFSSLYQKLFHVRPAGPVILSKS